MITISINWQCFLIFLVICVSLSNGQIKCLKCNSKEDPLCSVLPQEIFTIESCEKECVSLIDVDGNTVRRCALDSDDCTQSKCEKCTTEKCNSEIFPSNRRKCYQCAGSSCIFLSPYAEPVPCRKFVDGDQCFTHVLEKQNATRGCVSDENRKCTEAKALCIRCKDGDGCNNQMGLHTVRCFDCDSSLNKKCQRPETPPFNENCEIDNRITQCSHQELLGRQGNCYTTIFQNSIVRSCRPIFSNARSYSCKGDLCNTRCFEDISCIQCNNNDTNCNQESGLESFYETCPTYTTNCYRCENFAGNETIRGCGFKWDMERICTTCTENGGCNAKKPPRVCYKCDSRTNRLCSSLNRQSISVPAEPCNQTDDYCITMLNTDGYTLRGCMKEIPIADCSDKDKNCIKCDGHLCNIGLIPKNRLHCYQCDGAYEHNCNRDQFVSTAIACARYVPNDKCYTFAWSNRSMVRGCQSDDNIKQLICETVKDNKCVKCESSSCNKLSYQVLPKLKCYHCDGNNIKCPWSYNETYYCLNEFEFWKKESCFSYKHENGSVSRGCTHDSDLCSIEQDQNCMKFEGDLSNEKTTIIQSCYVCGMNEKDSENCPGNPDEMKPVPCEHETISYENRGCFKRVLDGKITRGCRADLTKYHWEQCENNTFCAIYTCIPDSCNKSSFRQVSLLAVLSILFYWMVSSGYARVVA